MTDEEKITRREAFEAWKELAKQDFEAQRQARREAFESHKTTAKQEHDELFREHDTWSKETKKALDLSDGVPAGVDAATPTEISSFSDLSTSMQQYQTNMNRLLVRMQNILIESVLHIEALEANWNRLK